MMMLPEKTGKSATPAWKYPRGGLYNRALPKYPASLSRLTPFSGVQSVNEC